MTEQRSWTCGVRGLRAGLFVKALYFQVFNMQFFIPCYRLMYRVDLGICFRSKQNASEPVMFWLTSECHISILQ